MKVTGPASDANWTITYFDALTGGTDITALVTGISGWTSPQLLQNGTLDLRVEVTPKTGAPNGAVNNVLVTATSNGDDLKRMPSSQRPRCSWPDLADVRHDPAHIGRSAFSGPATAAQKWAVTTGNVIESSAAIAVDGTIYVGSDDNKLYALNPDGTQQWAFVAGDKMLTSPALAVDGTVYIASADQKLYAVNPDGAAEMVIPAQHARPLLTHGRAGRHRLHRRV